MTTRIRTQSGALYLFEVEQSNASVRQEEGAPGVPAERVGVAYVTRLSERPMETYGRPQPTLQRRLVERWAPPELGSSFSYRIEEGWCRSSYVTEVIEADQR